MKRRLFTVFFCLTISLFIIDAQEVESGIPKTYSLMAGYGTNGVLETYLSPYKYCGSNYRFIGEVISYGHERKTLSQHILNLDYARTTNFSGRGLCHVGFIDYSFGRQYRIYQNDKWNFMSGAAADLNAGCLYNVRNSNNPAQAKVALNLQYSGIAEYKFRLFSNTFRLNYQFRTPLLGVGFAPDFGASYYEMFQLNNTKGIIHFLSLHNQLAMQNMLTLEIPFWGKAVRLGYYNNIYQMRINSIETSIAAHNIVIGLSGDILSVDRRKKRGAKP